jgi:uncharacterized membrane protein YphA (DoxX/SURF4 family)
MNRSALPYWIFTALFTFAAAGSGVADLLGPPPIVEAMQHLGYPGYLAAVLGGWKLLGVAAILAPRLPRLKEWAYAGFLFDLSGAAISHISVGDGPGVFAIPLVILALGMGSWATRPAERRLGGNPVLGGRVASLAS